MNKKQRLKQLRNKHTEVFYRLDFMRNKDTKEYLELHRLLDLLFLKILHLTNCTDNEMLKEYNTSFKELIVLK